jgi:folate-binding protein YgfZ
MSDSTALRLEGRDVLTVLHRISTQFLADLPRGGARATLFCDFRGRLLHRAVVARTADDAVWLLRDDAPGASLAAWVDRHVFREDVRIDDRSGAIAVWTPSHEARLVTGTLEERGGIPVAVRVDEHASLAAGPAPPDAAAIADARARIEAGRPAHGHEIAEEFTPYEVGLAHEVHLDKGCFTGQEALQRLVTYRSVRRRLARIEGRGGAPSPPRDVTSGGTRLGRLTSAIGAPAHEAHDRWIGLAVLRHEAIDEVRPLEAEGAGPIGQPHAFPLTQPLGRP